MFYLTTHSTHFIYGYMASDMVKDHSDSEKGNPLPPHRLLFRLTARVLLYAPSHRQDSTYQEHWLEREIAQWVHPMKDRSDDPSHHERKLLPRSYISLLGARCNVYCLSWDFRIAEYHIFIKNMCY